MTLHEEVLRILKERGDWMTTGDIVSALRSRGREIPTALQFYQSLDALLGTHKIKFKRRWVGKRSFLVFMVKEGS